MFVEAWTRSALAQVCDRLGYSATDAVLLRHHTNAVYAVEDVVVKIAPPEYGLDRLKSVVDLVTWLTGSDFPTATLTPRLAQPLEVDGHAVTIWQRLDPAIDNPVTTEELGTLLRQLHALPAPPVPLPALRPTDSIRHSISASTILADGQRGLLTARLDLLTKSWEAMRFPLGTSIIQSDPQTRNALRRADGTAVLADWDGAAIGPREWDVATIAVHCRRFTPSDKHAFPAFTSAYGWNATTWDGFEDLCQLRELQMIATNARKSRLGTTAAAEVHHRITGLPNGDALGRPWQII